MSPIQLPDVRSGDHLATLGSGVVSAFIAGWTGLKTLIDGWGYPLVSHTAALVKKGDQAWVYESTSTPILPDARDGRWREGVQCHKLEDYLRAYPGRVYHVPLKRPLDDPISYRAYLERRHTDQIVYDLRGAIRSGSWLAWTLHKLRNGKRFRTPVKDTETHKPLYCSSYYTYALRYGGVDLPMHPRRYHPRNVLLLPIFHPPQLIKEAA